MIPTRYHSDASNAVNSRRSATLRARRVLAILLTALFCQTSLLFAQNMTASSFSWTDAQPENPRVFSDACGLIEPVLLPTQREQTQTLASQSAGLSEDASIVRGTDLSILSVYPYRGRVFGNAFASWGSQDSQGQSADVSGFDVGSYGGALGQDWTLTEHFLWGYGVQAGQTTLDAKSSSSYDASIDSLAGFLRMSVFDALWHIDLLYGGAKNWEKQTKLSTKSGNSFSTTEWFFESEFGAKFDQGYTRIEPRLNLRVLSLVEPTKAEKFYVSTSRANEFSSTSYRAKLGSRFSWEYATNFGVSKPYITADWSHEFGNRAIYTIDDQATIPVAYRFAKHKLARDKLALGAGLDYALKETCDVYMRYDVEVAKEYADYLFFAGFNKKF